MRFHLIDRVDELEANRHVVARKVTSHREDYWRELGRGPEMPAHLVLESLCQAGTWLVVTSTEGRLRAALLSIDSVVFGDPVRPGDVLTLTGGVESISDEIAVLSGTASVDGKVVLEAESIMCALIAADQLDSPEETERMRHQLAGHLPVKQLVAAGGAR
ncbi:3-hydroxylacyl-ACP dehydratase [Saccharothrix sp. NRRL B-16314]|uniref:3-hydroxylacyl-ACP dehydratase n=1 Tax=Saccharothrix sp. NRRL B-16314 TaxID=1463825 RepID=UPI000525B0E6|nr:3-hydroxylacyl-ACP dehydratase [Saccharothrix sp. NRRL B-16314]